MIISAIISFFSIFFVESNVSFYDIILKKIGLECEFNALITVILTSVVIFAVPVNNKYNFMQREEKEYHQRYREKDELKAHQAEIENQKNQRLKELKNNYGNDMIPIDLNYQSNDLCE